MGLDYKYDEKEIRQQRQRIKDKFVFFTEVYECF